MDTKMNIPAAKPFFQDDDIENLLNDIRDVLHSGRLILGPKAKKFEEMFADYIGVKDAISVNSCTTALEIVLRYLNVRDNEVIVPTNTFIATANAVIYAGGKPVLADIKRETLCIDPDDVMERITPRTKCIIVVHIAGLVCPEMKEMRKICEENDLFLIEDAAHAHGATLDTKKAGSLGDFGCFSFYPTKVMTTGTGGMITTNDDKFSEFARSVRHHGQGEDLTQIIRLGNDWVMNEVIATLGIYHLKRLEDCVKRRNEIAEQYTEGLKKMGSFVPFKVPSNIRHSYYKYPVSLPLDIKRKELKQHFKEYYGIDIGSIYYPPCHLQPLYKGIFGYNEGMFPVAEEVLNQVICLPMYPQMKDNEVNYVLDCLRLWHQ